MTARGTLGLKVACALAAVGAVAGVFFVHERLAANRAAAAKAARIARLAHFGVNSTGEESFFVLPPFVPADTRAAALGGDLFHDKRLTPPAKRTCFSCHPLNAGGADGRLHGGVFTRPVHNAAFAERFLADGSLTNLEDVVVRMATDPKFGGGTNLTYAAGWINSDIKFAYRYRKVFPEGVTTTNLPVALASYVRTLTTANGPFDRFLAGQKDALSPEAARGFEIFKRQNCLSCHEGPGLGGWKISDGKKVPLLRGLRERKFYQAGGLRNDLSAVLPFMPGGELDVVEDRLALVAFLKIL